MQLVLTGRVYSKKNSKRRIMRGRKIYLVPSEAFERFKYDAIGQLRKQTIERIKSPVRVHCAFYIQGKIHVDGDNLLTSIFDILQDSGILADDDLVMFGSFEKHPGCGGWSTKIQIEPY